MCESGSVHLQMTIRREKLVGKRQGFFAIGMEFSKRQSFLTKKLHSGVFSLKVCAQSVQTVETAVIFLIDRTLDSLSLSLLSPAATLFGLKLRDGRVFAVFFAAAFCNCHFVAFFTRKMISLLEKGNGGHSAGRARTGRILFVLHSIAAIPFSPVAAKLRRSLDHYAPLGIKSFFGHLHAKITEPFF